MTPDQIKELTRHLSELSFDESRRLFDYFPDTGEIRRKVSMGRSRMGSLAGSKNSDGYLQIKVFYRTYKIHRLAWLMFYGKWPDGEIDHINGDRTDNRIVNLRDVPKSVNQQNQMKPQVTNTSGYLGVSWHKKDCKWRVSIRVSGKPKHLGFFATPEEAHAAYVKAKRQFHKGNTL
jgi:hypothetical protein